MADIIPIHKVVFPAEFWTCWQAMDQQGRDAHLLGTMQVLNIKVDDLGKRIDDLDDILADLME